MAKLEWDKKLPVQVYNQVIMLEVLRISVSY